MPPKRRSSVLNSAGREAAVSVPAEGYGATDERVDGMENARGTPTAKRGKGNQARQRTTSRPHSEQTVPSSKDWLTDVHVACTTSGALKSKKYNHLLQRVMLAYPMHEQLLLQSLRSLNTPDRAANLMLNGGSAVCFSCPVTTGDNVDPADLESIFA
eukprot:tig00000369_g24603.t1